jgi:carbon monoxide dehydrogenase subunit G
MTTLERSILINAPVDAIEAITDDARRLPEWYAGIEQAEPDDVFPQVGGKVALVYKASGVTFNLTQTSVERVPGEGGVNQMEGMIAGTNRMTFEPEGEGTRVTMTFEYEMPGGGVGKLFDRLVVERMNAQNLERSLKNLKGLLES